MGIMRYIRTKDNIFEVENTKPFCCIFCKPKHIKMLVAISDKEYEMRDIVIKKEIGKSHWKDEIIKQADTIEELCDEFVRVREDIHDFLVSDDIPTQINGWTIYGAIWTDKGLIYVAKMNEKGTLELL